MRNRFARTILMAAVCALALGACSMAPRGKTVRLWTPAAQATATAAAADVVSLKKASPIRLEALDQAGYFYSGSELVYGWLDNDHLAAVGTKYIAQGTGEPLPARPADKALREKLLQSKGMSANGIVGQILSVDWKTGEATELHTVQDEVITSLGLSHDRTKLWYLSSDGMAGGRLSMSDISFKHDMMDVEDYSGAYPAWSSKDKYLYFINYIKSAKARPMLTLFDGVTTTELAVPDLTAGGVSLIHVDDENNRAVSVVKNAVLVSVGLPDASGYPGADGKEVFQEFSNGKEGIPGQIYKTVWLGSKYMLMLSTGGEDTSFGILEIGSDRAPYWYDGVLNFALSGDGKYVCLVRRSQGNTADVSVAEWKNGKISNETILFKGFIATDAIYFSPDSTKLYLQGRYNYSDLYVTAMVLQFR